MKTLRKPSKSDIVLNLFEEVGTTYSVEQVCDISGVRNYNALKAMFSYIRNAEHIPDEMRIDVRIRDGQCIRVN